MISYYDILEISEGASSEVIQSAYRALAKKYHPDTYKGDLQYANSMMQKINEAYEVLSNADKRRLYDEQLKSDSQRTKEADKSTAQSSTGGSAYASTEPAYSSSPSKPKKGCLSGCLLNFLKFCFWLVVVAACLHYCSKTGDGQRILDDLEQAVSPATVSTPLSDLYDQIVEDTMREGQEAENAEDRQEKFTDALVLQVSEYTFKVHVYMHYVDDAYENQPFSKQMEKEIHATMDLMKQFFSEEFVTITVAVCIDETSNFYWEMRGEFDYMLGDEWTEKNIDVDYLWELYLSKTHMLDEYMEG